MKERLRRFMQGRYGVDELSRALNWFIILVFLAGIFLTGKGKMVLYALGWIALIFSYVRVFSRNHRRCWEQNQKYLSVRNRFLGFFRRQKSYAAQKKTHRIYTCPGCGQKIRVPKGKGKIEIRCPKCRATFIKRS
jgi:DNA-directed RNA polymerase subunit RPC12/RpoP